MCELRCADICRWPDGGTPNTYPGEGNSFIMPLEPPYETLTVVSCGATWAYFQPGGKNASCLSLCCLRLHRDGKPAFLGSMQAFPMGIALQPQRPCC